MTLSGFPFTFHQHPDFHDVYCSLYDSFEYLQQRNMQAMIVSTSHIEKLFCHYLLKFWTCMVSVLI